MDGIDLGAVEAFKSYTIIYENDCDFVDHSYDAWLISGHEFVLVEILLAKSDHDGILYAI